jgi:hypothetical protein
LFTISTGDVEARHPITLALLRKEWAADGK